MVDRGVLHSLLLETSDKEKKLKFYCAIVEVMVSPGRLVSGQSLDFGYHDDPEFYEKRLLKWHLVDEFFFDQIHKDRVIALEFFFKNDFIGFWH